MAAGWQAGSGGDRVTDLDAVRHAGSAQARLADTAAPTCTSPTYEGGAGIIALLDTQERQTFRKFLDESAENWCALVVNAVAERLCGGRLAVRASPPTRRRTIWQANHMNADHKMVQRDALVTGGGYVLVQPDDTNPSGVSITAESPLECTVLYQPGSRRRRLAGYKRFRRSDGSQQDHRGRECWPRRRSRRGWPGAGRAGRGRQPGRGRALFEVVPQPRTTAHGASELDPVIPIQDRVHTTLFNRCVASDFGAFRQIWATGVKLARQIITAERRPTSEVAVKPFDIGANRLLTNEDPAGRFGAFPGDALTGLPGAVQQDIEAMASITQTPAYYFPTARLVNLSADAIKAAEAGLVCKVADRAEFIGEAWTDVMRLALGLSATRPRRG